MSKKWREGSAGAAEEKQERIALIAVTVLTVLAWLCFAAFNTDAHAFFKRASTFDNIGGSLVSLGSAGYMWWAVKNYVDGKRFVYWLIALGIGLCWSCGFNFDYFGL